MTYRGHPVYLYIGDQKPGDMTGPTETYRLTPGVLDYQEPPGWRDTDRRVVTLLQCVLELGPGSDAERGEDFAQVVLDGTSTDK